MQKIVKYHFSLSCLLFNWLYLKLYNDKKSYYIPIDLPLSIKMYSKLGLNTYKYLNTHYTITIYQYESTILVILYYTSRYSHSITNTQLLSTFFIYSAQKDKNSKNYSIPILPQRNPYYKAKFFNFQAFFRLFFNFLSKFFV